MSTESRSGHRTLVVEDNAFAVLDIGEMLTERGFCVVGLATTASDAIDKAAAGADLALVDVLLAGRSNGIEAAAVLRDRYGIPSLFITATVPDVAEARMTGLGHLSKPLRTTICCGASTPSWRCLKDGNRRNCRRI